MQVTEPHFVALMNYKAKDEDVSFRNQILITVALLSPDARFQVQNIYILLFFSDVFLLNVGCTSFLFSDFVE